MNGALQNNGARRSAAAASARRCAAKISPMIASRPSPCFTEAKTVGPAPRILSASRRITSQVRADGRREVDLVDHEDVRLRDARPALARHLVAARDVDDVDREVRELVREVRREVVAARLAQQQLGVGVGQRQGLEGLEVRAHVLADRRVRACL